MWTYSNVWSTSGRIVSDNKRDFELYLRTLWAQTNRVGPTTFESQVTSNLCGCNCFGFVDGTVRPICRLTKHQRVVYNGHKWVHSIKFQSVTLPNGMFANMFGPVGMFV